MSVYGAWVLPETWGIVAGSLALVFGMIIIAGRSKARRDAKKLPFALWVVALMGGLALAVNSAGDIVGYAVDHLYVYDLRYDFSIKSEIFSWLVRLLVLAGLIGLVRLRRGWWFFRVIMLSLALVCVLVVAYRILVPMAKGSWPSQPIPYTMNGWLMHISAVHVLAMLGFALAWVVGEGLLLLWPGVRNRFRRPSDVPLEVSTLSQ